MPIEISPISHSGLPKKPTLAVVASSWNPQEEKFCYFDGITWGPRTDDYQDAFCGVKFGEPFKLHEAWWPHQRGEILSWREVTITPTKENPFDHIKLPEPVPLETPSEIGYPMFVSARVKSPVEIDLALTYEKVNLWHAATGISGEAGEFLDCIKKHVVYAQPLNRENAIEELGDLEFYMEQARQQLGVSREEVLAANVAKLEKRYPISYTDQAAKERKDKE